MLRKLAMGIGLVMATGTVVPGARAESAAWQGSHHEPATLPEVDELRSCYSLAQKAPGGDKAQAAPAVPPSDRRALAMAVSRAESCAALAQRLLVARQPAAKLTVEVAPGTSRDLSELADDLETARREAVARQAADEKERTVVRARWLRVLFGDRLRVFNEHPDRLPEYDGKARGPLPASVAPRWHYRDADGKTQTFWFRRNRLISKKEETLLRS